MDGAVYITVRVRKYLWSEFMHDVCYVLYTTIIITNALSKRYLKLSLRQLAKGFLKSIQWAFWIFMIGIWTYLIIRG